MCTKFFVGPQISCSGCRNEGNDSDDGEFESDRAATDVDSDHGNVSGKSKRRRKKSNGPPCTSSPMERLVVPKNKEQAERMGELYRHASEMERKLKKENKRIKETRNLTLLDLTDTAINLQRREPIREDIWRKLEKEDYGLYGITVRQTGASGETILGTTVKSENKKRAGEVVEAKMEKGYNVFTIEWSDRKGNALSVYTTREVLCSRDDGQGVVSLDEANACMRVFLLAALCMVNTQVHQFIDNDIKVENVKYLCTLPDGQKGNDIKAGRRYAWGEMEKASVKAMDMLMDKEKQFLKSSEDEGLLAEMKDNTCFQMMGLDAYKKISIKGLVDSGEDFNPKSLAFVNHFVRGAQASFRLGRATNFAASTIHLSVNELPPGLELTTLEEKRFCVFNPGESMTKYSLGMRCVLARARVKDSGDDSNGESSTCQFLMRFPLYRLLDLSRVDGLPLCPTTEHSSCVSPTLRHEDAYSQAFSTHETKDQDLKVFKQIKIGYHRVSREKRSEKSVVENANEKVAFGIKWTKGRTHLVGSDKCMNGYLLLEELVTRNGINSFMNKLPDKDAVVKMCNEVLEMNPTRIGKHTNEDHFYPAEFRDRIEQVVRHLIDDKIFSRSDISLFSWALTVMDSVLTAALRKQDTLGQLARDLHRLKCRDVQGKDIAITRCLLPKYFKNKKSLENSTCGVVVNHTKDEKCAEAYAVMAVVGRRVMRQLLDDDLGQSELTPYLGPFDENGRQITPTAMTRMYKWLGQRTMGISHFGHHIIRSNHATAVAMYCVRNGLSVDHQAVKDLFALARHGEKQRLRYYTQVKADSPNSCPIMTRFSGVKASLCELSEDCAAGQASGKKIGNLCDIAEVGLSGIFAFQDFNPDKPDIAKTYAGGGGGLKVVEMDEDEKALAKKLRMAQMAADLAKVEAKNTDAAGGVVKSDGGEEKGVRGENFAYRAIAFPKVNRLVLEASKKTLGAFGKKAKPKRSTLQYSLKHHQKTIRVAFHEHVRTFLYSNNPEEKDFLTDFYSEFKQASSKTGPGNKAEEYRKEHGMEWTYHDWGSDNVCTVTRKKEGKGGGKKRKVCDAGSGKSG